MDKQQYEQLDTQQFEQGGGEVQAPDQGIQDEPVTRNELLCQRALEFSLGIKNLVYAKENPFDGTYSIDFKLDKDKIKSIYKTFYYRRNVLNLFAPEQSGSIGKLRRRTGKIDVIPQGLYEQEAINLLRLNLPLEDLDPSGVSSIKSLKINDNNVILGSTLYTPILGDEPTSSNLQQITCDQNGCYCTFSPDNDIVFISIPPPRI